MYTDADVARIYTSPSLRNKIKMCFRKSQDEPWVSSKPRLLRSRFQTRSVDTYTVHIYFTYVVQRIMYPRFEVSYSI